MSEKKYPESAKFLLAEDIRMDAGGKPIVLGLYVNDMILVDLPDNTPEPSASQPIILPEMAVLASFPDTNGTFSGTLSIIDPAGKIVLQTGAGEFQTESTGILNIVSKFRPFAVENFGQFNFTVELDGKIFEFPFSIVRNVALKTDS